MALPHVFSTYPTGNFPASNWDDNWNAVAAMGVVQCTATGTNTIALSPITNMPAIAAYTNQQLFNFVPAANTTGSVTVNVSSVGAVNLYLPDGVTQAGSGDLSTAGVYTVEYLSALNSSAGGFIIVSIMTTAMLLTKLAQQFSGGVRVTCFSGGTISSGTFTPDSGNGPLQFITNGGAFTFAAPTHDGACDVMVTNNASAGTITFSGYTVSANTGDSLNTTNTDVFIISVRRINGTATYVIKALQ